MRAEVVVRATEGYTVELPGAKRQVVPVYSLMVATAPLPAEAWAAIGLGRRETFTDLRHLVIYGQRTADDRLAFGGRGAPYHLGSAIRPEFDRNRRVHDGLVATLADLFPVLGGVEITHRWGGPLGLPRDWHPSVGLDRADADSPGPAATSATVWGPRTSPAGRFATSCSDARASSAGSAGWATGHVRGSPSRSATSGSTPACGR